MSKAEDRWYSVYNLTVRSSIELPLRELDNTDQATPHSSGEPLDVEVTVLSPREIAEREVRGCYAATSQEAHLHYNGLAEIHIRDGREIEVHPSCDAHLTLLKQFIVGVSLGILLHQRGYLTLHASAVELRAGAIAFVGWKRMGKSTTSAALHAAGHPMITDDTVVCGLDDVATVLPGVRQFKLDPVAVSEALRLAPESLPRLHKEHDRRLHLVDDRYQPKALPLRRVFVLGWGDALDIQRLNPADALVEFVQHSYALRFLGKNGGTRRHFGQASELASRVPVYRLTRPRSIDALPSVIREIELLDEGSEDGE